MKISSQEWNILELKKKTMNFPSQSFYGKNILENYNISTNIIISFDQRCQGTMVTSKM